MKISVGVGHITIDDNSNEAKKIKDGKDYVIENGKIKVLSTDKIDSKYYLLKKISNSNDWIEARQYIIKFLENIN